MLIISMADSQFIVYTDNGAYFQSCSFVVAHIDKDLNITLGKNWNSSRTIKKYLSQFLKKPYKDIVNDFKTNKIKFDKDLKIKLP